MAKPTPTKLVLLMSAAGLSLSWSGVALASRDDSQAVGTSLGGAPAQTQDCNAGGSDQWMSCPAGDGELVRTLVAQSASLPLPLPVGPNGTSNEARPAGRPQDGVVAAASVQAAPVSRGDGNGGDEREANALAWVLLDDVQAIAELSSVVSTPTRSITSSAARTADAASDGGTQRGAQDAAAQVAPATASPATDSSTDHAVAATDPATLERVLASLAAVLGADLDDAAAAARVYAEPARPSPQPLAATAFESERAPVAPVSSRPELDLPAAAVTAVPQAAQSDAAASPEDIAASSERDAQRASEADAIVVAASHSDKVLMSLQALRSAEGDDASHAPGAMETPVVVQHSDKVLETLALFRSRPSDRTTHACAIPGAPQAAAVALHTVHSYQTAADEALARLGLELDIDLDLIASAAPPAADATSDAQGLSMAQADAMANERAGHSALGGELVALRSAELDEVRGGFVTDGGLKISFGIERAVYLNGTLVTTTSLNIADLARISGGQAQVTGNGFGSLGQVQSGPGNVFMPGAISTTAAGGLVIQNTLDYQKINTITRIDAVVNSTSIMRSMNLQSSMQSAIVNSLRR